MNSTNIFVKRQQQLQKSFASWGIDAFVCDHPTDIFYLTGMHLSLGRLLVAPHLVVLFVDGRYEESAKKKATALVKKLNDEAFLKVLSSKKLKDVRCIGFDTQTSFAKVELLKKLIKKQCKMKGLFAPILELRSIKDASELKRIKKSAKLLWEGFLHAKKKLKVGVEERQIALEFEFYCKERGAEDLSFTPIIAFGANSALPHHLTGRRTLKKGDIVLMDLGVKVDGYASDMTRTFFFGEGSTTLQKLYKVVEDSKEAALELCRPGVPLTEIDQAARKVMAKAQLEKHFLHSLGHGIGLDVHESPSFRDKKAVLKPGMVITIEPGLYLPGSGGVRLEDMVVITKTCHQNLFSN